MKALIFDMDGTLIDSEPNYLASDLELVRRCGGEMTEEEHDQCVGMGSLKFLQMIKERWQIEDSLESLLALKDQLYMERARAHTPVFPVMRELLDHLAALEVPLALASGSSAAVIRELTAQTGIQDYFQVLLSAEEVEQGKPAPDIFLEAARRLGAEPSDCTVLEDSQYGVTAAKAAGMACAALPGHRPGGALPRAFEEADFLAPRGIEDFSAKEFLLWWDRKRAASRLAPV